MDGTPLELPPSSEMGHAMDDAYRDEVQLPADTEMQDGWPVVEDWQSDEDE